MRAGPEITPEEVHANFERQLAVSYMQKTYPPTEQGFNEMTQKALEAVADEPSDERVARARSAIADQLCGKHARDDVVEMFGFDPATLERP